MIKHLVISGGGSTGMLYYGALKETCRRGVWQQKNIQSIHATSVGSILAVFISLKYDWEVLDDYIIKRPWHQLFTMNLQMAFQSISNGGLFDHDKLCKVFTPLLKGKDLSIDITMQQFYEYNGIEMQFVTTEFKEFTQEIISHKTHPDWKLIDAVYASSCLPIFFTPFSFGEKIYIDGGIFANYPMFLCKDKNCNEVLGFCKKTPNNTNTVDADPTIKMLSLFDYLLNLLQKLLRSMNRTNYFNTSLLKYQIFVCHNSSSLENCNEIAEVLSSQDERTRLIQNGINDANDFINTHHEIDWNATTTDEDVSNV